MERLFSKYMMGVLLMLMSSHLSLLAQGEYNPTNPAEPYQYNKLTMKASPTEAVSSLYGAGYYVEGTTVRLQSYARGSIYIFSHWEKDGAWFSDEPYPYFTMGNDAVTFTACYVFTPDSPSEPKLDDNRLYLVAEPLTACTFNIQSGKSYGYGNAVSLRANGNTSYSFLGWYEGFRLVSKNQNFSFSMPERDLTLTARFEFNPNSPDEPTGSGPAGEESYAAGDVNRDGVVDIADAVSVVNFILSGGSSAEADVNKDGVIDVADVVAIINVCLKTEGE